MLAHTNRVVALVFRPLPGPADLLPERARVVAVCVRDEDDIEAGTPLFELAAE